MAVRITKRAVDAEQPGARDRFIFDTEVRGFGLKITPAGKKVYVLQYRMGGRGAPTKRYTIAEHGELTAEKARDEAIKLRGKIRAGTDPQAEKKAAAKPLPKPQTFVDTADAYIRHARRSLRPSSLKEWSRILDRDVKPRWHSRHTDSITRRDVRDLLDDIAARGAPVQANRTRARLQTLFTWAVEHDIVPASPIAGVKPIAKEVERHRVLSDEEIGWFWRSCDAIEWPFGPLFKLLLLTAQRRDEVGTMEWSEIDLEKNVWTIPRNKVKNDRTHEVPLSDAAVELLNSLPRIGVRSLYNEGGVAPAIKYVFTTNGKTPVSGFSRAKARLDGAMIKARRKSLGLPDENDTSREALGDSPEVLRNAEIPDWILHDLRRTAATGMAKLRVPPHVVDKILNHISGTIRGVAAIYNRHGYVKERRAALDKWGRYVAALV